ncbi:MAG TPA: hypothetical protein VMU48_17710 [Terracidiphilus sp.]|nr:hypothetical protein [Terracidiphilus sp.]
MTQDTFRTAYQQANSELGSIREQFDRLRTKKEQIERVVEALRPLLEAKDESNSTGHSIVDPSLFLVDEAPAVSHELPALAMEKAPEPVIEPVELTSEMSAEPVQLAKEPSSDPFQRRIESVLWGWSQKREGMAPAV